MHGGVHSNNLNVRMFGMYGLKDRFRCTEGQNYTREVHPCNDYCNHCIGIKRFKDAYSGRLIMPMLDNHKEALVCTT